MIETNDDWLGRFLEHNENNEQEALHMLWETCAWRQKFGVNGKPLTERGQILLFQLERYLTIFYRYCLIADITEESVKRNYLEDGLCFIYGKDKDDKTMFVIRCKLHTKGSKDFSELQKLVVYWFERLER